MKFSEVIGQEKAKEKLIGSVKKGKVPHAQLFLAPEGAGGLPMALAFAQYLNCPNRTEEDSCGTCPSCLKMQKLIHPDVHYSYPVVTNPNIKKPKALDYIGQWREAITTEPYISYFDWLQHIGAENKQGNISIDECHSILQRLSLKAYEGGNKFLIMWMPEQMGKEGNSLLKAIEEPPANTYFLFVAEEQDSILNTILSRTQLLRLPGLPDETIAQALQKNLGTGPETAIQMARLSSGSFYKAKTILQEDKKNYTEVFRNWLNLCFKLQRPELLIWIDDLAGSGRENIKNFLRYGTHMLREALLLQYATGQVQRLNQEENELAGKFSKFISEENAQPMLELFNTAHYHVERNANPKILFFNLSLQVSRLLRQKKAATA